MKKILLITILIINTSVFLLASAWGTTWYVDSANGNDGWSGTSIGWPKEHISAVLDDGSFGDDDTIILRNSDYFADEGTYSAWMSHYVIDNDGITIEKYSGDSKPRIIAYEQAGDTLRRVFVVNGSDVTFDKIKFNASHPVSGDDAELHIGIWLRCTADRASITECEFRNFGAESGQNPEPQFQALISMYGIADTLLNDVSVDNCYFTNNPFATNHGHEFYLHKTRDVIISNNTLHTSGVGDQIKLRHDCQGTIIRDNKLYVAHTSFVEDYPNSGSEVSSSGTEIYDNYFYKNDDSTSVNTTMSTYKGPFWNPRRYPFITDFYDNTMDCEFTTNDNHKIFGVACNDSCTFIAVDRPDINRNYIYKFQEREGPMFMICLDQPHYNNDVRGDMCTTDSYVIISTVKYIDASTDSINVYRIKNDGTQSNANVNATRIFASTSSNDIITALCNYNSNEFLTAITGSDSVRIYKSTDSSGGLKNTWIWTAAASVDSITAMTYNYSNNRLLIATQVGSQARISLGSIQNPDSTTVYSLTSNRYIPGIYYGAGSSYVMTALKNTSTNYLYTYTGIYTNPVNTQGYSGSQKNLKGLAGYGTYRYTSISGSSGDERKLFLGSSLGQVLFYSQWWHDSNVE
ncbi:hypothetical protein ACFL60_05475 [Candidatus Omnitrophota bacterium]